MIKKKNTNPFKKRIKIVFVIKILNIKFLIKNNSRIRNCSKGLEKNIRSKKYILFFLRLKKNNMYFLDLFSHIYSKLRH